MSFVCRFVACRLRHINYRMCILTRATRTHANDTRKTVRQGAHVSSLTIHRDARVSLCVFDIESPRDAYIDPHASMTMPTPGNDMNTGVGIIVRHDPNDNKDHDVVACVMG